MVISILLRHKLYPVKEIQLSQGLSVVGGRNKYHDRGHSLKIQSDHKAFGIP